MDDEDDTDAIKNAEIEPPIVVDDSSDDENSDDENPNPIDESNSISKSSNVANQTPLQNSLPMSTEESSSEQLSSQRDQPGTSREGLGPEITSGESTKKSKCDQTFLPTPSYFKCRFICPKPNENTFGSIDALAKHYDDQTNSCRFI